MEAKEVDDGKDGKAVFQSIKEWAAVAIFPVLAAIVVWGGIASSDRQEREEREASITRCYNSIGNQRIEERIQQLQQELGTPGADRPITPLSPECEELKERIRREQNGV